MRPCRHSWPCAAFRATSTPSPARRALSIPTAPAACTAATSCSPPCLKRWRPSTSPPPRTRAPRRPEAPRPRSCAHRQRAPCQRRRVRLGSARRLARAAATRSRHTLLCTRDHPPNCPAATANTFVCGMGVHMYVNVHVHSRGMAVHAGVSAAGVRGPCADAPETAASAAVHRDANAAGGAQRQPRHRLQGRLARAQAEGELREGGGHGGERHRQRRGQPGSAAGGSGHSSRVENRSAAGAAPLCPAPYSRAGTG